MATSVPEPVAPPVTGRPRSSATPDQARMSRTPADRPVPGVRCGRALPVGGRQVAWRRPVAVREHPRLWHRLLPRPAVAPAVRDRPQPAPLVGDRRRPGGAGATQPGVVAASVPGRRIVLHVARGGTGVRRRHAARAGARDALRPLRPARARVRAVRRGQPDDPDRGPRADDRVRVRAVGDRRSWSSRRT